LIFFSIGNFVRLQRSSGQSKAACQTRWAKVGIKWIDGRMEEVMMLLYWLKTTEEEDISCGQPIMENKTLPTL
jgi:hypothetical protein